VLFCDVYLGEFVFDVVFYAGFIISNNVVLVFYAGMGLSVK